MVYRKRDILALKRKRAKASFTASFDGKSANEIADRIRTASDGFLVSREWKELRAKVISMYGSTCMACKREPKRRSVNVDHIKPRKLFPELALDFDNLQVLCGRCNKSKGNKRFTDYRPHLGDAIASQNVRVEP